MARILLVLVQAAAVLAVQNAVTPKPKKVLDTIMNPSYIPAEEKHGSYWKKAAKSTIKSKIAETLNTNKAHNGILFIGDGMSLATVMAARTFAGQRNSGLGEDNILDFERFPVTGLTRTYCLDAQVPDSACTATSYLTGVKTKYGVIGLDGNVTRGACHPQLHKGNWATSIGEWALEQGLDVGLVTTTRVTHASPAGMYAHTSERNWESDADVPDECLKMGCRDIAYQLAMNNPGRQFKVIMGGGRRELLPNLKNPLVNGTGRRLDGLDLTEMWHIDKTEKNATHQYVTDRSELMKVFNSDDLPEYLLGLFQDDHMSYHLKASNQPTLEEMVEVAIKMLSRSQKGYFLFVEGGRIDHAHHDSLAHLALDETVEYSKAVKKAKELTNPEETLIVVTSDHAHTMTVAGYPSRGNDILGAVDTTTGGDGKPYTTISYANGKGKSIGEDGTRVDVTLHQAFMAHSKRPQLFDEKNKEHWHRQAQWTLRTKLTTPLNTNVAKNVIFFLGDGMSVTTLAATRVYLGQKYGHMGEEIKLSFETFPYTGLSKTYCIDHNVADSACSGTAYLTGVKANSGTVGLSAGVKRGDCLGQKSGNYSVTGLVDWAQKAGKSTGVVTTTRVTHATPAASYAHSADRRWEADTDLPRNGPRCDDIATQLVRGRVGGNIDVILGGGRRSFFPYFSRDEEGNMGYRSDGADLIKEWLKTKEKLGFSAKYVMNKTDLINLDSESCNSVLGLFAPDHMPYHIEASPEDPSLAEMTQKAIQILSKNKKGFFLFVEGGRIDTAHHETKAQKALDETVELAKAVEMAMRMVDTEETLVLVTSDHSHTMTYSGYSKRGSDILGFSNRINASDHQPFTTLSYATGPGHKPGHDSERYNLTFDDLQDPNYTYPALVPMRRETHGGEDVAVYAKGPWAHLFTGNYEQNYIPHAIAYAACMGSGLHACNS